MNQNMLRRVRLLILFAVIWTFALFQNFATAAGNLTLYTYQTELAYPEDAKVHLLIIAHRPDIDPLPVCLYTTDGTTYAPIPLDDPSLDWAVRSKPKQGVKPFVELVLGAGVADDLKGAPVEAFQRDKLDFPSERPEGGGIWADGEWGNGTWTALANRIISNTLDPPVVDLRESSALLGGTPLFSDPSPSLAKYDPPEMKAFATSVLQGFHFRQALIDVPQKTEALERKLQELTDKLHNPVRGDIPSLIDDVKANNQLIKANDQSISKIDRKISYLIGVTIVLAVIMVGLVGLAILIYVGRKAHRNEAEPQIPQSSIEQIRELEKGKVLEKIEKATTQIRELEKGGVLEKIKEASPDIQTATEQIDKMAHLLGAAQKSSNQIISYESQAKTAKSEAEDAKDQAKALVELGRVQETELIENLTQVSGEIDEILARSREKSEDVNALTEELWSKAETADKALEQIEDRGTTQEQAIQSELAAEHLLERRCENLPKDFDGEIPPDKPQGLQKAEELLEDFSDRMNEVDKAIPSSIQQALEEVNSLLNRFTPLPQFEPPSLPSLQEHNAKQAKQIANAIVDKTQIQWQSAYVQALEEYDRRLEARVQELKSGAARPSPLTDDELNRKFRDLALVTLNPFDSKAKEDREMQTIITYFDKKVLPELAPAFGFEEIPITIGQTQAVESLHEIVDGRSSSSPSGSIISGSIIEVLSKGLRSKRDPSDIVRRARVICAE